jgi:hypothetical protein
MGSANIRWFEEGQTNGGETENDAAARTRGRKIPSVSIITILSGGERLEFAGLVFGEIGCRGAMKALFAVDGGMDFSGRKNEAVAGWEILQAFHFTEFQEVGGFLHGGLVFRFADRPEGLQQGEVLLEAPVDALFVEREKLECLRLHREDARGCEGGIDLIVIGAELAAVFVEAESEEVVFDGADPVQSPTVGGDALGELHFHGSFGREILDESLGEFVVSGAVFVSHRGDLASDAVAASVHAGALATLFRFGTCGQKGVIAVRFKLFVGNHLCS